MNTPLIIEYKNLCTQLATVGSDESREDQLIDRLDRIWYAEMTSADRVETERQLAQDRAWHKSHHTETPWR